MDELTRFTPLQTDHVSATQRRGARTHPVLLGSLFRGPLRSPTAKIVDSLWNPSTTASTQNDRTRAPSPFVSSIEQQHRPARGVDFHCYQREDAGVSSADETTSCGKKAPRTRVSVLPSPVKRDLARSRLTLTNGSIDECGFVTFTLFVSRGLSF